MLTIQPSVYCCTHRMNARTSQTITVVLIGTLASQMLTMQTTFKLRPQTTIESTTVTALDNALPANPDFIIIDLPLAELSEMLIRIRTNPALKKTSVLVRANHFITGERLNGLLSTYRAMPCQDSEIMKLLKNRAAQFEHQPAQPFAIRKRSAAVL